VRACENDIRTLNHACTLSRAASRRKAHFSQRGVERGGKPTAYSAAMLPRLTSLLGLAAFIGIAWTMSNNRRRFPWRTVLSGLALQFAFALLILKTSAGLAIFGAVQGAVKRLGDFSDEGAAMAFGPLAKGEVLGQAFGSGNAYVFAVSITATIILISALSALLYHWGILQRIVQAMAWVMRSVMGTSGSESLAAASNIFLGQTEAALLVKPYIPRMTASEIMALMTAGMATIATGVMVVYPKLGLDAGHILTASVLSAPAALLVSKIMFPEVERSETAAGAPMKVEKTDANSLDSLCRGTSEGVLLAINVMGMLIAFVAVVALGNAVFGAAQGWLGIAPEKQFTLQILLGYLNAPFAWLMGVPWKDCTLVGQALGERIVLNEFIGYISLGRQKELLDPRSLTIATYALCGFANFASIAIQIGGIGAMAPTRRGDLARLGVRAMIAGLLACYITATVAGILI
jgi:concentrative nucleoside transporter, CNT family